MSDEPNRGPNPRPSGPSEWRRWLLMEAVRIVRAEQVRANNPLEPDTERES